MDKKCAKIIFEDDAYNYNCPFTGHACNGNECMGWIKIDDQIAEVGCCGMLDRIFYAKIGIPCARNENEQD